MGLNDHFMCSPLGLVPKKDSGLRRIHDLLHPLQRSVNAYINLDYSALQYTQIDQILDNIIKAGHYCIIFKRDIKDAFRNILIAP